MIHFLLGLWCGLCIGGGIFYNYGKKNLLLIMRIHNNNGLTLSQAIDYEENIRKGKRP